MVFGTRPEAIKMAPLSHELSARGHLEVLIAVTGQHRQMLDQTLALFDIVPDHDLDVMKENQDLFDVTSSVLLGMRGVIARERPDAILVHGDTTTTLAASLSAFYAGVPLGHVEAGLRTHNLVAPFPEEFNRQVASKLATWHFAPTDESKTNLLAEGVLAENIAVTGNTGIDALFWVLARIDESDRRSAECQRVLDSHLDFDWRHSPLVLITGHRRENFGNGFQEICRALQTLAMKFPAVQFVYPVHLNPKVQEPVRSILTGLSNVHLIPPLTYEPFVYLLRQSHLVLTDSGGIQEEGPSLGKPVLVMRDVTERPEAVTAGTVRLVGANYARIVESVSELLENSQVYLAMSKAHNPYGDGRASRRIADLLERDL
jgi:UDP-N-acetylglucosamine 2-epimerase (non-hydrolysing)